MNLFEKNDIIEEPKPRTKSKEIVINMVANKGGYKNLTSTEITNGKKMFYIQGEAKKFLESNDSLNHSVKEWEEWLDDKCREEYNISLEKVCKILGKRLYEWLKNPLLLPTPEEAKKYGRVGVDGEDREIIKNSVEYYGITEEDCIDWVYNLIVYRNYEGAIAQKVVRDIIKSELSKLGINATVELTGKEDDSKGIDLIIKKDDKILKFQIKGKTFHSSDSIKKWYDDSYKSHDDSILYIEYDYDDSGNLRINDLDEIKVIIKETFNK